MQVIETSKTKLSDDHPHTLIYTNQIASTYANQGRWEEAEQLQMQVMVIRKMKLGLGHPDTLTSMNNLAHILKSLGQHTAALELTAKCVELRDGKLGSDHPHTVSSKSALNEWRGKIDSLSSRCTSLPTDTKVASILGTPQKSPSRFIDLADIVGEHNSCTSLAESRTPLSKFPGV